MTKKFFNFQMNSLLGGSRIETEIISLNMVIDLPLRPFLNYLKLMAPAIPLIGQKKVTFLLQLNSFS